MISKIKYDPFQLVQSKPLEIFRFLFGILMIISLVRFWAMGWINEFYVMPKYHFSFYGFDWVKYPGEIGIYLMFSLMIITAFFIMIGKFYRISAILFFLLFTYVELIDKTLYLNHYYFVSLISFLMIFLPADKKEALIPRWTIDILKFQLIVVYFFAGFAKLNSDWLLNAMPLKLWLPASSHLPIIGELLKYEITAYIFSWFGAIYDLSIWMFLLIPKTRKVAYLFVLIFHLSTALLFNIGMFPYIMCALTLIFFDFKSSKVRQDVKVNFNPVILKTALSIFVLFQILYPLRNNLYEGNGFWHEQAYRFGWRVMLMEKAGYVEFKLVDSKTGKVEIISPSDYLTKVQETQMSTQADMILQFAKILEQEYLKKGFQDPKIYADSYASLNGSGARRFIDNNQDLSKLDDGFSTKGWILHFEK